MTVRNLLIEPYWEAKDLGKAIPHSPHAVSVALPRWVDVIDYEEKNPKCLNKLQAIYPRFGLNPLVEELAKKCLSRSEEGASSCWPYPNLTTALKAKEYSERVTQNSKAKIVEISGLYCLLVNDDTTKSAKAFWQHTGLGASSRQAAIALNKSHAPTNDSGERARNILRNRLAKIYECNPDLVQLHPSGMAALTTALEALKRLRPKRPILQLGFPYVDVLKLPQVIFDGSELILDTRAESIEQKLDQIQPSAVIVELPSNPMLQCINLPQIAEMAHKRGIPVIADDTIGSPVNINALPYADLIFGSLTKSFAGRGDILAGSLIISPESQWSKMLKKVIPSVSFTSISSSEAIALEEASRDVELRIDQLNHSCLFLKNRLENHSEIEKVLHPANCENFKLLMKPNAGFGCLLSLQLKGGLQKAKRFYDSLEVCKGPSLGTNFTLVCPYVLLAHYQELKWAEKCGVPPSLIRVSVGLENPHELWKRFKKALSA